MDLSYEAQIEVTCLFLPRLFPARGLSCHGMGAGWILRKATREEMGMRETLASKGAIMFGKIAYEAYRVDTGGISLVSKQPIPEWEQLPAQIKHAWTVGGDAVRDSVLREIRDYIDELGDED